MTAMTSDRNTAERNAEVFEFPIAAGVTIFRGALIALNAAGAALRPQDAGAVQIAGVAQTGSADFIPGGSSAPGQFPSGGLITDQPTPSVRVRRRKQFAFANSTGADLIASANFGATAYAVDDQTVALTSNSGARLAVGTIRSVDQQGVWVEI